LGSWLVTLKFPSDISEMKSVFQMTGNLYTVELCGFRAKILNDEIQIITTLTVMVCSAVREMYYSKCKLKQYPRISLFYSTKVGIHSAVLTTGSWFLHNR
jgi:hypothetical protein